MAPALDLKAGQTVEVRLEKPKPTIHRGTIRYIGEVAVPGQEGIEFVGIELPGATGKNDGSVQGERYFQCPPMHGLFAARDKVTKIIAQPRPVAPKAAPPKPSASSARPRPSSVGASQTTTRPARLSSVGGSKPTTLQARLAAAVKPSSPVKSAATARPPSTTRPPSATSRASVTPSAQSRRVSVAGSSQPSATTRPSRKPSFSSAASLETRSVAPSTTATSATKAPAERTRQIPEAEYRRLQKQQEDTSQLEADVLKLRTENERYKETIFPKLNEKVQKYGTENSSFKEEIAHLKGENDKLEKALQERDTMVELATIDKEMAEEQREQLEAELENERAIVEELRLELEIKQEEASFIDDDMPEDEKQAAMLRQAQNERDRYREGIVRLRDMTREQIKGLETRNRELEAQVAHTEIVEADLAAAKDEVVKLEGYISDLRERVDTNNEMEEMNEELIDKIATLEDSISRLRLERRELSTMIEVSNETINDYAEHADDLEAELETRDSQLADVSRQRDAAEIDNAELQDRLSKYQTVAMELQSQVRDLRADKATTEEEVKDVTGRFNEVMELQRRLRTAGVKDTNRHIDASLQHLAARDAQEERDMIKHYLTESSYADFHSSSVKAYFRAKSISFKAELTASVIRTITTDQFGAEQGPEQTLDVLVRHDVVGHFDYIHTYAEQIWIAMASCSLDEFEKAGQLFQEFESVLRTVEGCMGSLKRDELNLKDSLESARGSYNVLGAIYRSNSYLSHARPDSTIILHVSVIRASLERIRSVFDAVKTFVSRVEPIYENVEDHVDLDAFAEPAQTATEALNIVTKFSSALQALQKDGLYPSLPDGIEGLIDISESLDRFANKAQETAVTFIRLVLGKLGKEPEGFDATMMSAQLETLFKKDLLGELHASVNGVKSRIGQWHEHASILNNCVEVQLQPAPWFVKAQQIEAEKKQSIESEKKLQLMTTELQSALLQVRERQETIDTKELEIEHLRARNQEAAVKAGTIETLQTELDKARSEREIYRSEAETLRSEITRLEREGVPRQDDDSQTIPATPQPTRERSEVVEAPQANTSSSFITLVKALTNENQWLRQRESSDMLSFNLEAVFTKTRTDRAARVKADARNKQALAAEMLDMAFTSHLMGVQGSVTRPLEIWSDELTESAKGEKFAVPQDRQRKGSPAFPLTLATGTDPLAYIDDLSFVDLSPVAEEFLFEFPDC
ncbi:uncharacterized protein N0V89_004271 [Didymosphaeria variabile]|uniref:CAP-Gly domain-containing protein n=1 Tax=Didymosphaeria variabile TaxID=1932322 RepID=A0A9W8XRI9_9PLEO|nr:uncharacterized protein N0V89_004271 [Didymosphaeria variabile]KAJ4356241.1 hypothetical protein N0V89_004271 [Didymosphaeria variabile]